MNALHLLCTPRVFKRGVSWISVQEGQRSACWVLSRNDSVANLVSEHACELIHDQYASHFIVHFYTFSMGSPGVYLVKSTCTDEYALDEVNTEYTVTELDWTCSCSL
ncbi:hypothetical protein GQ600_7673 [Phytophthora cactorum]|nr:hypothetical protein GQ600_7673 [Phytophthora cactorum]